VGEEDIDFSTRGGVLDVIIRGGFEWATVVVERSSPAHAKVRSSSQLEAQASRCNPDTVSGAKEPVWMILEFFMQSIPPLMVARHEDESLKLKALQLLVEPGRELLSRSVAPTSRARQRGGPAEVADMKQRSDVRCFPPDALKQRGDEARL